MRQDPLINSVIDSRYRIATQLGSGGQGGVYLVEEAPFGEVSERVVLKLVHRRFDHPDYQSEDEIAFNRFDTRRALAELTVPMVLKHPNIVRHLECGAWSAWGQDYFYHVIERASTSLAKLLKSAPQPLGRSVALDIGRSIGSALYVLNSLGIVHRDVKPDNILKVGSVWKLADFGLAREVGARTVRGSAVGTPGYISPEGAQGKWSPTKSDAFSLGCVMHECLTGVVPQWGMSGLDMGPLSMLRKESPNLLKALMGLLELNHESRMTVSEAFAVLYDKLQLAPLSETIPTSFSLVRIDLFDESRRKLIHRSDESRIRFSELELPPGYDRSEWHVWDESTDGSVWLISPTVNRLISRTDVSYYRVHRPFRHLENVRDFREITVIDPTYYVGRNPPQFNEDKVRICTDIVPEMLRGHSVSVGLQRVDYLDGLSTNDVVQSLIKDRDSGAVIIDGRGFVVANGNLLRLDQSAASLHVGVSTMAVTSQGSLIITQQGSASVESGGRYAPSGSGSSDWNDLTEASTFSDVIRIGMEREFKEESTKRGVQHVVVKTAILGYGRLLTRAGKPEFFGLSFVDISDGEIESDDLFTLNNHRKWPTGMQFDGDDHRDCTRLEQALVKVMHSYEGSGSGQLIYSCKCIVDCLREDRDVILKLLADFRTAMADAREND